MREKMVLRKRMVLVPLALAGLAGAALCVLKPAPSVPPPTPPALSGPGGAKPWPERADVIGTMSSRPLTSWEHPLPGGGVRDDMTGGTSFVFTAIDPAQLPRDTAGRALVARIGALSAKIGDDVPTIPFRRPGHPLAPRTPGVGVRRRQGSHSQPTR